MHRSQSLVDLEDFQHKSSTGEEIPGEAIGIAQSASSLQSTQHHCSDAKDLPSLPDDEDEDLLAVDMELDGDVSDEQGVAGLPTKKFECSICHDEYIANEMLAYYCHCERKLCYNCLESSFKAALSWHETGYAPRCLCSTRILFNDVAHQFTSSFLEEHGVQDRRARLYSSNILRKERLQRFLDRWGRSGWPRRLRDLQMLQG